MELYLTKNLARNNGVSSNKKNEINVASRINTITENMKPIHSINIELNCSTITYGPRTYLLDEEDEMTIVSSQKRFTLKSSLEMYPYYKDNGIQKNYLDLLFNPQGKRVRYTFINGNEYDLRRSNVSVFIYEEPLLVTKKYGEIEHVIPTFSKDEELDCYVIECGTHKYLVDRDGYQLIISSGKAFYFDPQKDEYPYYKNSNNKLVNYIEIIYSINPSLNIVRFKNNNKNDLRRCNTIITPHYFARAIEGYNIIEYIGSHFPKTGVHAGVIKNPTWKIREDDGTETIVMYCEPGVLCKLCDESYEIITVFEREHNKGTKITWHQHTNGYIQGHLIGKTLYIHQIIMNCFGNGKGTATFSVDHIDRNTLNNRRNNLRIATREEQQNNTKGIIPGTKRERSSKKELPEGLTYDMLHKFVYYNIEKYGSGDKTREFFRVEHSDLPKCWSSSKSEKVSITDKLASANKVAEDLEKGILPDKKVRSVANVINTKQTSKKDTSEQSTTNNNITITATNTVIEPLKQKKEETEQVALPKYVRIEISREKPHLTFDKRTENGRFGVRMVIKNGTDIRGTLIKLNEKIIEKYGEEHGVIGK